MSDSAFADYVRSILDYEPNSGVFVWRHQRNGRVKAGSVAGTNVDGYVKIKFDRRIHSAHRLAWLVMHDSWPAGEIDHVNGDRGDNRIANLRDVTKTVNQQNIRRARATNKTGTLGTCFRKDRGDYQAYISADKKRHHLGFFKSPEQAHQAYLDAKRRLHAGCTI